MSYTLGLKPNAARGEAPLADLPGASAALKTAPTLPGLNNATAGQEMFIRAAELRKRVVDTYAAPDVMGIGRIVWPRVMGRRGFVYIEDCYQTAGDLKMADWTLGLRTPVTGDHWDLFDGMLLVSLQFMLSNNAFPRDLYFWETRR